MDKDLESISPPNVLAALKRLALPAEYLSARPKRLRFLFLNVAGRVSYHARKMHLRLTALSREADRSDKLEAPGKELVRLMRQEEDKRAAQEKARLISKPKFGP